MAGPDPVGPIRREIVALIEGRYEDGSPAGFSDGVCDRSIESGRFRHVETEVDAAGPEGGAEPRHPFTVRLGGYAGNADTPTDVTGGSYLYGRERITIEVGYGDRPQKQGELDDQMSRDQRDIINVLMAEQNMSVVEGWSGVEVVSSDQREGGPGEEPSMIINVIDVEVIYRYYRGAA